PLDPLDGKRREIPRADEPHLPNAAAIGEGEALAVRVQLPSRLLVLDRATIMLEAGVSLLPWSLLTTGGVEALDGRPGAGGGGGLAGLRVEVGGERVVVG